MAKAFHRTKRPLTQQIATAREMAFFIKFALVRQMNLGRYRHKISVLQECGTVVKATEHAERKPHCNYRIAICKRIRNL